MKLRLHYTIPLLAQAPFSSSSNHNSVVQLRQLWNGGHTSNDGLQDHSDSSNICGDWAGLLDEFEDDDDEDYVPDARDDKEAARTMSELTPLEM